MRLPAATSEILRGEAPIALVRMLEHPTTARLVPDATGPIEIALHLDPTTAMARRTARGAVELLSSQAHDMRQAWLSHQPDARFPFQAAVLDQSGAWQVSQLVPWMDGAPIADAAAAARAINNGSEHGVTRTADELRLVAHGSFGFSFRGDEQLASVRRVHEMPLRALGDAYDPVMVDSHLADAKTLLDDVDVALGALHPRRHGFELRRTIVDGDPGTHALATARTRVHRRIQDALEELGRPLPDELARVAMPPRLRDEVARMRAAVTAAENAIRETFPNESRAAIDVDAWRDALARTRTRLDAAGVAPVVDDESALSAFRAFHGRLFGASADTREAAIRAFDYGSFGRTPGERMRNFGSAFQALEDGVGFGDRSIGRLKSWLRGVAADAQQLRTELPPDREHLRPLLDAVVDNGRRNGVDGVVVNAQGKVGYDVYPDFAEVGRMSAALRTYLHVDDATGAARIADDVSVNVEALDW